MAVLVMCFGRGDDITQHSMDRRLLDGGGDAERVNSVLIGMY